jgi:hypothetical protein
MKCTIFLVKLLLISCLIYGQDPLPYFQDFEGSTFPPAGCDTNSNGSGVNWTLNNNASAYGIGTSCMSFDNFNTVSGSFEFRLPPLSFTSETHPYIRFDVAYAEKVLGISDTLQVWWSPNGTTNWQNLQNYEGNSLATSPFTPNVFVPVPTDWRTVLFPLTYVVNVPYVRLCLTNGCSNGNMLYVDNIMIFDSSLTAVDDPETSYWNINMNPVSQLLSVNSLIAADHSSEIIIYSISGKESLHKTFFRTTDIDLSLFPDNIYMYSVFSKNKSVSGKFVKAGN